MKTFEEVPAGALFARRHLEHEPYEVCTKLRDPFRIYLPDGLMTVNSIGIKDGSRHSVNLREPVKRVGILLGIRTLFAGRA